MIEVIIILVVALVICLFIIYGMIRSNNKLRKQVKENNSLVHELYSYIKKIGKIEDWRKEIENKNKKDSASALSDIINSNNSKLHDNKKN